MLKQKKTICFVNTDINHVYLLLSKLNNYTWKLLRRLIVLNLLCCLLKFSSYVLMSFDSITPIVLTNGPHNLVRVYIWNLFFKIQLSFGKYIYNGCLRFFVKLIHKTGNAIIRRVEFGSLTDILTLFVYVTYTLGTF